MHEPPPGPLLQYASALHTIQFGIASLRGVDRATMGVTNAINATMNVFFMMTSYNAGGGVSSTRSRRRIIYRSGRAHTADYARAAEGFFGFAASAISSAACALAFDVA